MASYRACLGLSLPLLTVALAFLACDETTSQPDGPEDKDGVNVIPSPNGSNGASMGVGANGQGGGGGGAMGKPCEMPVECNDDDPCTIDLCTNMMCQNVDAANDNNACTTDMCNPDTGDISNQPIQIDDNDVCTFDACDVVTGPSHLPGRTLFAEDFSDNAQLWSLGPQWVIGSAAFSNGGLNGGNDPDADHSTTDDDGVATSGQGALLMPTAGNSFLTSPAIPISGVPAGEFVTLDFWRWLNADAPPEMTAFIEAFDGTAFVPVWQSTVQVIDSPPLGTGWVEVRVDVTAQALACQASNTPFRMRFGFTKGNAMPSIGGWNIDDLALYHTKIQTDDNVCTTDTCADDGNGNPVGTFPAVTAIDDGDDCTDFVCVDNSGPQQQPNGGPGCP